MGYHAPVAKWNERRYSATVKDKHYYRRRRRERKKAATEYLGAKCASCGANEDLEFDHVFPHTKTFKISEGLLRAEKVFWEEVEKCQLLCAVCHLKKTAGDMGYGLRQHGTTTMYRHGRCRCRPCSEANYECVKRWRKDRKPA